MRPIILIVLIVVAVIGVGTAILSNAINLTLQEIGIFNFKVVVSCFEGSEDCFVNGQQVAFEPGLEDRAKGYVVPIDERPKAESDDKEDKKDEKSNVGHDDVPDKRTIRLFEHKELDQYHGCPPSFWIAALSSQGVYWPAGYMPDEKFGSPAYFNYEIAISSGKDPTLLSSLKSEGDGINKLSRQSVAALLNAAHPEINYPLTIQEVISATYDSIEKQNYDAAEDFAVYNNLGRSDFCQSKLPNPSDLD